MLTPNEKYGIVKVIIGVIIMVLVIRNIRVNMINIVIQLVQYIVNIKVRLNLSQWILPE